MIAVTCFDIPLWLVSVMLRVYGVFNKSNMIYVKAKKQVT